MPKCWAIWGCLLTLTNLATADDQKHIVSLTLHVISAEGVELDPQADASAILKAESDWAAAGKLLSAMDIQLTAIEGQLASCHFGTTESIMTGRNYMGGFSRTAPGGPGVANSVPVYTREQAGTIFSATTEVTAAGVMADLTFEQSKFVKPAPQGESQDALVLPEKETSVVKTRVLLPENQPIVIGGVLTKVVKEKSISSVMIATAKVGAAVPVKSAQVSPKLLQVFALQKLKAKPTQEFLSQIFAEDELRFSTDERTNSLVAYGTTEQLAGLKSVLQQLDQ